ncbi:UDP-glucuronic acid decarboxylase 1-like, partial [Primulina huaijiensis]|uniref:UDP-glucuronic acid decarboxylase 1-like n=1 Tax=Primulina huaijiensis TaxID=1492673 RepID=UPI003CC7545B
INYLLKEQRLLFIFVCILIGSSFFILQPSLSRVSTSSSVDPRNHISSRSSESTLASYDPRELGQNYGNWDSGSNGYRPNGVGGVPVGIKGKRKRIVVTGGAGFVGSHLVDKLIARGDDVIVMDNFFTRRKENIVHLFGNPRFELIRHDVVEPILLEVDQIYHLACHASSVHYKYNPVKTIISLFSDVMAILSVTIC